MAFSKCPYCGKQIFNLKTESAGNYTVVSCRECNKVLSIFPSR